MSNIKMIFLSKLFFFTEDNELIKDNLRIADKFYENEVKLTVVAQKSTIRKLNPLIPESYKEKIGMIDRGSDSKNKVKALKEKGAILGMMGIVDQDAIFSFNCKIPLFNPEQLSSGRVEISEKVRNYGLPIIEFQNVIDCLKSYEIHKDNYFQISFNNQFTVISLNNANTYYRPEEEVRIKEIFETNLKEKDSTRNKRILLLLLFHLMNEVTTNNHFEDVDYWGSFPSSDLENTNTSVSFLKEAVRKIVNGKPKRGPELFIRSTSIKPKHKSRTELRLSNKSDQDFDTLIINPKLINKIEGKVICIIDDYITNGYSAETAKHLLFKAGVKRVIFISLGKFEKKYYSTNYVLEGNVSEEYTYRFINETCYSESINGKELYN